MSTRKQRRQALRQERPHTAAPQPPPPENAPFRRELFLLSTALSNESKTMLGGLYDEYFQEFQPETAIEIHLVETLISARWQCQRYRLIENALLELELLRTSEPADLPVGQGTRLALAFEKQCGKASALKAALHAATQCERSYQINLKLLRSEIANRPEPPSSNDTNSTSLCAPERSAPAARTEKDEDGPAPGVIVFPTPPVPTRRPNALSRFPEPTHRPPDETAASDPALPVPKDWSEAA